MVDHDMIELSNLNRQILHWDKDIVKRKAESAEEKLKEINPEKTACLRCIFPEAPQPETFPVIGVTPGVIGLIQATEVIKYITGIGELLAGKLLIWDGLIRVLKRSQWKEIRNAWIVVIVEGAMKQIPENRFTITHVTLTIGTMKGAEF